MIVLVENVGDQSHPAMRDQRLTVGRDDSRRLLSAMLLRVEAEVREVGGLRMSIDAEHAALLVEDVEVRFFDCSMRTDSSSVTASEPPWNRVFVNSLQLGNVFIERPANLQPRIGDYVSDNCKLQSSTGKQFLNAGHIIRRNRQNHGRCTFTEKNRVGVSSSPKFNFGSQNRPRIETGFHQCNRKPALGDIVS